MTKVSRIPLDQEKWHRFLKSFWRGVAMLKSEKEAEHFFRDLLTPTELKMFLKRLEIAKLLSDGKDYDFRKKEVHVTNSTVAHVNLWLNNGVGGLKIVATRLLKLTKEN
jgi:TrpR-related protein YerC/YecD